MRTTVDLPDDLHRIASAIARDRGTSLSEVVASLVRRGLGSDVAADITTSQRTGFKVIRLGRTLTTEDVRALDDEP